MRKLLLGTAAVALGMSFAASDAQAQVKLDLGGHVKFYTSWLDQDTANDDLDTVVGAIPLTTTNESESERSIDILHETEIHFTGETTLDNGLTVGFHAEADISGSDSLQGADFTAEEGYAYFSGAWGRLNAGLEDGATYLLQVAAPSADSNFDGIRQWVDPVNNSILAAPAITGANTVDNISLDDLFGGTTAPGGAAGVDGMANSGAVIIDADSSDTRSANDIVLGVNGEGIAVSSRFDYDQAIAGYSEKLTYMTPVFNGFQAGVSYTPEVTLPRDWANGDDDGAFTTAAGTAIATQYGDVWELAARYEGMLGEVGVALGGGWSRSELEHNNDNPVFFQDVNADGAYTSGTDISVAHLDDREAWNIGVDFDWKAFGLGASYMEDDNGVSGDKFASETWVVGLDYTTGPFKLGATYYSQDHNVASAELETDRYTGGVVYTYGPGMTFRGSVSYIDFDEDVGYASSDADATSVLLGTQINF